MSGSKNLNLTNQHSEAACFELTPADQFLAGMSIRPGRGLLFVATQGLGDLVQTLPLLRAICDLAETRLPIYLLLASPLQFELLREEKLLLSQICVRDGLGERRSRLKLWKKIVGKIDLIVSAPEISAVKLVSLKYVTGTRYAFGEASDLWSRFLTFSVQQSWTTPWSRALDEIALALGITVPLPSPQIHLSRREIEWADAALIEAGLSASNLVVGVHCSSVAPEKKWPVENFADLLRRMRKLFTGLHVISFGSADELLDARQARRYAVNVPWLEGAGKWNLRETMAMLSRCDLFVSGDTGLMHIAAALGIPTVSIFGPTSASRRAPRHNRGVAICPQTSCHPCFRGKWNGCQCIRSISTEAVFHAAASLIRSKNEPREFDTSAHSASFEVANH